MALDPNINTLEKGKFRDSVNGPVVAVTVEQSNLSSLFDTATAIIYIGDAIRGSLTSDPVWKISRVDTSSSLITILTASDGYDQIWNDRASLTYV